VTGPHDRPTRILGPPPDGPPTLPFTALRPEPIRRTAGGARDANRCNLSRHFRSPYASHCLDGCAMGLSARPHPWSSSFSFLPSSRLDDWMCRDTHAGHLALPADRSGLRRLDLLVLLLALAMLVAWAQLSCISTPGTDGRGCVCPVLRAARDARPQSVRTNLLPALTHFASHPIRTTSSTDISLICVSSLSSCSPSPSPPYPRCAGDHRRERLFLAVEMVCLPLHAATYRSFAVVVVLGLPFLFDYTVGGDIVTMSSLSFSFLPTAGPTSAEAAPRQRGIFERLPRLAASVCQFACSRSVRALGVWCVRSIELGRKQAS